MNRARKRKQKVLNEVMRTVFVVGLVIFAWIIAHPWLTEGPSMEPSIHSGEKVVVEKWTYLFHPPARGDVVVFRAPPILSKYHVKYLVKRIIAIPEDEITIDDTVVIVNGVKLDESSYVAPWLQGNPENNKYQHLRIPEGDFWAMGDDRKFSSDSRWFGVVPLASIVGKVTFVCCVQNNTGFIRGPGSAFSSVPQATLILPSQTVRISSVPVDGILLGIPGVLVLLLRRSMRRRRLHV